MDRMHVETDIKQMVGEFMDCAKVVRSAEVMRNAAEDKETVELASAWAAHLTEQSMKLAFDEEMGVHPILALAFLACDIAANVSNMMFQVEAETSLGGEEE